MLRFGPKPVRPIGVLPSGLKRDALILLSARISLPKTVPLRRQDVRLKDAPRPVGPTNVVAQWPSFGQPDATLVFVSTSQSHSGSPISGTPRVKVALLDRLKDACHIEQQKCFGSSQASSYSKSE